MAERKRDGLVVWIARDAGWRSVREKAEGPSGENAVNEKKKKTKKRKEIEEEKNYV